MTFCANCGSPCPSCSSKAEEDKAINAEVEKVRLETNRDIQVARIQANAAVTMIADEAAAEAAHAEGVIEGVGAVIDAATGEAPTEEPIPVVMPEPEPELEPEPVDELALPPVEESGMPKEPKKAGYWDAYR